SPPRSNTERAPLNLLEWNESLDSREDAFDTDELEEFKSTDFGFLIPRATKRSLSEPPDEPPPSKRRKLDMASLGGILPQPHALPSPASISTKTQSVPAYSRKKPIPIAPHALPILPPPPYSRRSWVIPLRGVLPWEHATSAVFLLDPTDPPEPPDPKTHEEIAWTAAALRSFWSFLISARDLHAVGLSFHVMSSVEPSTVLSSHQGIGTLPLVYSDHIKVYHDAAHSMRIRNLLHVWAFEPGDGVKIRLLKGARLVLLDERSKGILVS
ncbi:hypothetical protein B0H15DRAFT_776339, partial [Mycena belliarum]